MPREGVLAALQRMLVSCNHAIVGEGEADPAVKERFKWLINSLAFAGPQSHHGSADLALLADTELFKLALHFKDARSYEAIARRHIYSPKCLTDMPLSHLNKPFGLLGMEPVLPALQAFLLHETRYGKRILAVEQVSKGLAEDARNSIFRRSQGPGCLPGKCSPLTSDDVVDFIEVLEFVGAEPFNVRIFPLLGCGEGQLSFWTTLLREAPARSILDTAIPDVIGKFPSYLQRCRGKIKRRSHGHLGRLVDFGILPSARDTTSWRITSMELLELTLNMSDAAKSKELAEYMLDRILCLQRGVCDAERESLVANRLLRVKKMLATKGVRLADEPYKGQVHRYLEAVIGWRKMDRPELKPRQDDPPVFRYAAVSCNPCPHNLCKPLLTDYLSSQEQGPLIYYGNAEKRGHLIEIATKARLDDYTEEEDGLRWRLTFQKHAVPYERRLQKHNAPLEIARKVVSSLGDARFIFDCLDGDRVKYKQLMGAEAPINWPGSLPVPPETSGHQSTSTATAREAVELSLASSESGEGSEQTESEEGSNDEDYVSLIQLRGRRIRPSKRQSGKAPSGQSQHKKARVAA